MDILSVNVLKRNSHQIIAELLPNEVFRLNTFQDTFSFFIISQDYKNKNKNT